MRRLRGPRGRPENEVPETEVIDCDVLIGGGMAGRGSACEAAFRAKEPGLRAVVAEKAAMERSGDVAIGPCVDNNWLTLG